MIEQTEVFTSGRYFQTWDYTVSHHKLLLRSPLQEGGTDHLIDIQFIGVNWMDMPADFADLTVEQREYTCEDAYRYPVARHEALDALRVYHLRDTRGISGRLCASGGIWIFETRMDLSDTSLDGMGKWNTDSDSPRRTIYRWPHTSDR